MTLSEVNMKRSFEDILGSELKIVNVGVIGFAESVEEQGAEVVHIDWSPPAGGDTEMTELLDRLL